MGNIIFNKKLRDEYYLIKIEKENNALMGQFAMVRAWDNDPLLSRPLSIFDRDEKTMTFLYRTVGKGTNIMASLESGDNLDCEGPYGRGFPIVEGNIALVAGGVGIAPMYFAGKELMKNPNNKIDIFFSLRGEEMLREELSSVSHNLTLRTNARVVSLVDPDKYDYILTCGPNSLMKDVYTNSIGKKAKVYASLENRMGCGIGLCYVCTIASKTGNKLVCKDGPIFEGEVVFHE